MGVPATVPCARYSTDHLAATRAFERMQRPQGVKYTGAQLGKVWKAGWAKDGRGKAKWYEPWLGQGQTAAEAMCKAALMSVLLEPKRCKRCA